ncbi:MAG: hypothetical protein QM572_14015 [Nocardioides sp.]|uniref:hypothetical protein n=1 Tax=Nocardioides sp. TaxID=35761 RepID=UPI0039E25FC0
MTMDSEVRRALAERADSLGTSAPLSLADVLGRASRIRRRRAGAAGAGVLIVAAAVTAVVLPLTTSGSSTRSVDPASQVPSLSARTDDPTIPYLVDGQVMLPGGGQVGLDSDDPVTGFVPLTGGDVLFATDHEGDVWVRGGWGSSTASAAPVASADGRAAAWVDPSTLQVSMHIAGESTPITFGTIDASSARAGETQATVAAVTGSHCPQQCTVWVNVTQPDTAGETMSGSFVGMLRADDDVDAPWVHNEAVWSKGTAEPQMPELDDVVGDVAAATLEYAAAGSAAAGDDPQCEADGIVRWSGVADDDHGVRWRTCRWRDLDLSPSATYATGVPVQGDGLGPRSVGVLDAATGDQVAGVEAPGSTIMDSAWEDDRSLLLVTRDDDGRTWRLQRYDVEADTLVQLRTVSADPDDYGAIVLP